MILPEKNRITSCSHISTFLENSENVVNIKFEAVTSYSVKMADYFRQNLEFTCTPLHSVNV
jgi:hypothetical protein